MVNRSQDRSLCAAGKYRNRIDAQLVSLANDDSVTR
jgi:hypothetical protein